MKDKINNKRNREYSYSVGNLKKLNDSQVFSQRSRLENQRKDGQENWYYDNMNIQRMIKPIVANNHSFGEGEFDENLDKLGEFIDKSVKISGKLFLRWQLLNS